MTIFFEDDGRYFYVVISVDISPNVLFPIDGSFTPAFPVYLVTFEVVFIIFSIIFTLFWLFIYIF